MKKKCKLVLVTKWGYHFTPMDFPSIKSATDYVHGIWLVGHIFDMEGNLIKNVRPY